MKDKKRKEIERQKPQSKSKIEEKILKDFDFQCPIKKREKQFKIIEKQKRNLKRTLQLISH